MHADLDFEAPIAQVEEELEALLKKSKSPNSPAIAKLRKTLKKTCREVYANLTPWQTVQVARHPRRPILQDYLELLFDEFIELHGDRRFADDRALIGGFARLGERRIMLIGHNRGKNINENLDRNFGMAKPEGYRKALRLMELAEKYNLPVITFIDTAGAYPGIDAEERGQAEAIARNLTEMARLAVPIIAVITGEGGSGGALGIGVGDVILMLEHAIYSVISPEGCASILWRDAAYSATAAEALKITAPSLIELGVADEIIPEPPGGAHRDPEAAAREVGQALEKQLAALTALSSTKLLNRRFKKYSNIGQFNIVK